MLSAATQALPQTSTTRNASRSLRYMFDIYSQRLSNLDTGPGTREIKMSPEYSQIFVSVPSAFKLAFRCHGNVAPVHSSQCLHSWPKICLWHHHRPDKPSSSLRRHCVLLSYHRFLAPYSVHLLIARPVTTASLAESAFRNHVRRHIRYCSRPRGLDLGSPSVFEQETVISVVL